MHPFSQQQTTNQMNKKYKYVVVPQAGFIYRYIPQSFPQETPVESRTVRGEFLHTNGEAWSGETNYISEYCFSQKRVRPISENVVHYFEQNGGYNPEYFRRGY